MSGGKSSSSSKTSSTQTTIASDASGLVEGNVVQGELGAVTFNEEFTPEVAGAFQGLIDLTGQTIQGAGNIAQESIQQVSQRAESIDDPTLSTTREYTPLIMTGLVIAGIAIAITAWRK